MKAVSFGAMLKRTSCCRGLNNTVLTNIQPGHAELEQQELLAGLSTRHSATACKLRSRRLNDVSFG